MRDFWSQLVGRYARTYYEVGVNTRMHDGDHIRFVGFWLTERRARAWLLRQGYWTDPAVSPILMRIHRPSYEKVVLMAPPGWPVPPSEGYALP